MLQCTHPTETCVRRDSYSAIRNVLSQRTDGAEVLGGTIMACWADSDDGNIHTAGDDQEGGWRVPSLKSVGNGGHWEFDPGGDVPTFECNAYFDGDTDGDSDDAADEPSDGTHAAEERSGVTAAVATAAGAVDYVVDWDGVESSPRPTRRATQLLYRARQMVDTPRWWTMRWPTNAISLVARACRLDTEGIYKLLWELRKESVTHVRELWLVGMDRRHAAENTLARNTTREQWLKLQRTLGRPRNCHHKLMPDWATVKTKPLYSIRLSLARWLKVRRRNVASGGQQS